MPVHVPLVLVLPVAPAIEQPIPPRSDVTLPLADCYRP